MRHWISKSVQVIRTRFNEIKMEVSELRVNPKTFTIPQDVVTISTLPYILPCEKLQVVRNLGAIVCQYEHRPDWFRQVMERVKVILGLGHGRVSKNFEDFQEQCINDFKHKVLEKGGNYVLNTHFQQVYRAYGVSGFVYIVALCFETNMTIVA